MCSLQEACTFVREVLGLTYGLDLSSAGGEVLDHAVRRLYGNTSNSSQFAGALRAWPGFKHIFLGLTALFPGEKDTRPVTPLIPRKAIVPEGCTRLLLSKVERLILASLLSNEKRQEWRLLFNSDLHGKSFATFVGRIIDKGPTLLVVRPLLLLFIYFCCSACYILQSIAISIQHTQLITLRGMYSSFEFQSVSSATDCWPRFASLVKR